jgi:ATP/maltotriose-dependent transcriptional regulator MalT
VLNNLGVVEYNRTNYDGCRGYLREYMDIAEKVGDRESMTYVIGNIGVLHQEKGDLDEAMNCFERQLAMAGELGITYTISFAARQIGLVHRDRGDFVQAMEWLARSLRTAEDSGDARNASMTSRELGELCLQTGGLRRSREYLETAVRLAAEIDKETHATSLLMLAKLSARDGSWDEVLEHVDNLAALRREMGEEMRLLRSLTDSAGILLSAGHEERAGELLREAREIASGLDAGDSLQHLEFQEALLQARSNPAGAEERLTGLLKRNVRGEDFSAKVLFHLYRIKGREEYRQSALELYDGLFRRVPYEEYGEKLDLLRSAAFANPPEVQGQDNAGGERPQ